ncbi:MAG: HD domain-containing protein [Actinomycetota bacterium]
MKAWHLTKRFIGAVTAAPSTSAEREEIRRILLPSEQNLFDLFGTADQRHALTVLYRFADFAPEAPVEARRAALLHDIGKVESGLGTVARVVATVVGARGVRFQRYHDHERLGVELLTAAGSDTVTLQLLRGEGDASLLTALQRADEI